MTRLCYRQRRQSGGDGKVAGVENFELLMHTEFREMHGFTIPAGLVNSERRIAFNFEGCEDADRVWLEKVVGKEVSPGHFSFYFGPGTAMDEGLCRAILVRLAMFDLTVDMLRVKTPQVVHVS
jgi:hypothetical protein